LVFAVLTCPDCQAASERPHHGFARLCGGCQARAVARSDAFAEVRRSGLVTADCLVMLRRFGLAADAVTAAGEADALLEERAC
jgi:hypothetical protein